MSPSAVSIPVLLLVRLTRHHRSPSITVRDGGAERHALDVAQRYQRSSAPDGDGLRPAGSARKRLLISGAKVRVLDSPPIGLFTCDEAI